MLQDIQTLKNYFTESDVISFRYLILGLWALFKTEEVSIVFLQLRNSIIHTKTLSNSFFVLLIFRDAKQVNDV